MIRLETNMEEKSSQVQLENDSYVLYV